MDHVELKNVESASKLNDDGESEGNRQEYGGAPQQTDQSVQPGQVVSSGQAASSTLHYIQHPLQPYKDVTDSKAYQDGKYTVENKISVCFCCGWQVFRKALPVILMSYFLFAVIIDILDMVVGNMSFSMLSFFRLHRIAGDGEFVQEDDRRPRGKESSTDDDDDDDDEDLKGVRAMRLLVIIPLFLSVIMCILALRKTYQYFKKDTALTRLGLIKAINFILIAECVQGVVNFIVNIVDLDWRASFVLLSMALNLLVFFHIRAKLEIHYQNALMQYDS